MSVDRISRRLCSRVRSDAISRADTARDVHRMLADRGRPMHFGFTVAQELLRAEGRKFVEQNASLEEVRKIAVGRPDIQPDIIAERILGLPKDRDAGHHGST